MEDIGAAIDTSTLSKCRLFGGLITVEPILFLYSLAGSFQWPTVDALFYRKVCLNFYNTSICDNLSTVEYAAEEDVIQSHTSYWYLANNLCFEIPSIITSFFYGSLSDRFSRKTALVLPLIGQMITLAIYFVNALVFSLPIGCLLIGPVISGLFGGWITCNIAAYSYLSEVSTPENRAVRIALGESMSAISISIGFFASGVTLDHTNFQSVLAISFSFYVIAFLYAVFAVKDLNSGSQTGDPDKVDSVNKPPSCAHVFKTLCSKDSIRDALTVIFKPREGKHRAYVLILLFGMFSGILTGSGA
jgi:MFS family permease